MALKRTHASWKKYVRVRYESRAKNVFSRLLNRYYQKLEPYDKPLVQDAHNLPSELEWGSREHALFLWNVCQWMKGGINSEVAIVQMAKLYNHYPEVFMPESLMGFEQYELEWAIEWLKLVLREHGLGSNVEEAAWSWIYNSWKLMKHWDSDPRNLMKEAELCADTAWLSFEAAKENYDQVCRNVIRKSSWDHERWMRESRGFYGFQHKMVSMIIYFFIHAGMMKQIPYPVPVDFHILRVLISTGILGFRQKRRDLSGRLWEYRERFTPAARDVTLRYVVEQRADPQHLADVLWILSRSWCRQHPGNRSSVEKTRTARRRHITDMPVVWNRGNERRYDRTCGQCPLDDVCLLNIPSSYYYVKGKVLVRGKRNRPPQFKLLSVPTIKVPPKDRSSRRLLPVLSQPSFFD